MGEQDEMANPVQLVMTKGPWPGRRFSIDVGTLVLGRDPRSHIVIDHPQVSRRHARITQQDDAWMIEDLNSTNGTLVNGRQLIGPHTLVEGDAISLGDIVTLSFRQHDPPVEGPANTRAAWRPRDPRQQRRVRLDQSSRSAPSQTYRGLSVPAVPRERLPRDHTWLWLMFGVAVLLLLVACVSVFLLEYFGLLPGSLFYQPLRWLGLI